MARLYAHRGASAELPENTMPAFRRALELGADALELDVHLTADGAVVVAHDPDGRRMCGVDAAIRRAPLAEVKRWDAGWGFVDASGARFAGRGFEIPTLEELLAELPEVLLNIDIKQHSLRAVRAVVDLVRAHGAEDRVVLASFHLGVMLAARALGYRGLTALPRAEVLAMLLFPRPIFSRLPLRGGAAQIPVTAGPIDLGSPRIIDRCHRLGLRVDYFTVDDPELARRLVAAGADGIMTNDPRRLAGVFRAAA